MIDAANNQTWMAHPGRNCALPKDAPPRDKQLKADQWYPHETHQEASRSLCNGCPVKTPCLAYALENNEEGIWGGTTEQMRRTMRRKAAA